MKSNALLILWAYYGDAWPEPLKAWSIQVRHMMEAYLYSTKEDLMKEDLEKFNMKLKMTRRKC